MKKRWFVIDSEALEGVRSRLYGFMITDDGSLFLDEVPDRSFGSGCFVLIERQEDRIIIRQDHCGSFGLFLYRDGERFMISNSFQTLADALGKRLTLNRTYMESLIYASEGPILMTGTLANEITRLESDVRVEIGVSGKRLRVCREKRVFYARRAETAQDFEALDGWYMKWVRFYRGLALKRQPLYADLSGGLDTRIILSMLRTAGLDLNTAVRMTSHSRVNIPKDAEDMRISGLIARELGFALNGDAVRSVSAGHLDPADSYALSRRFTMGQTMYCRVHSFMEREPVFFAKGLGSTVKGSVSKKGGLLSGMAEALEEYDGVVASLCRARRDLSAREAEALCAEWHARFEAQAEKLTAGYAGDDEHRAAYFYQRTRMEGRDAKKILDSFLRNRLIVSPFTDPAISSFDYDPYGEDHLFLATLILDRYDPVLTRFDIEHRAFSPATLERVRELNCRFPVRLPAFPCVQGTPITVYSDTCPYEETTAFLRDLLYGSGLTGRLEPVVGRALLDAVLAEFPVELHEKRPYRPYALMAVYEFLLSLDG